MTYGRRRTYGDRAPLTAPSALVGRVVTWKPKGPDGKRGAVRAAYVKAYNAEARTLTMSVTETVFGKGAVERDVDIPLSQGPFTV